MTHPKFDVKISKFKCFAVFILRLCTKFAPCENVPLYGMCTLTRLSEVHPFACDDNEPVTIMRLSEVHPFACDDNEAIKRASIFLRQ